MHRLSTAALVLALAGGSLTITSCNNGGGSSNRGFSRGAAVKFRSRTDVPIQGTGSADVSLADLDGDGDLDLVSANIDLRGVPSSDGIEVFRNESGTLASLQTLGGCALPYDVETFDIDADGFLDIVASCRTDGILHFWFGDGSGGYPTTASGSIDLGGGPGGAVQAFALDGDGDGTLDLVCVEIVNSKIFFVRGVGSRAFAAPQEVPLGAFADARLSAVDVGDLEGDGDTDIVAADFTGARILTFLNDGTAQFTADAAIAVANGPLTTTLSDRDGDGDLDLFAGHFSSTSIVIWDNQGNGTFDSRREILTDSPVTDLIVLDWNDDGRGDLLAASFFNSSIDLHLADGLEYAEAQGYGVGFHVRRVQAGDLDGDAKVELVTANFEEAALTIVGRDDDGNPDVPRTFPAGRLPYYFAVGEFVDPKGPEVAAALYEEGALAFFSVGDAGNLVPLGKLQIPAPIRPNFVVAFDADDDKDLDLAVTDADGLGLVLAFNDGEMPFTRITTLSTQGWQLLGAAAGDLDDDKDLDLAVAASGNDRLLVFVNDGSGEFTERAPIAMGSHPAAVAFADLDRDGDLDVAVSEAGDDTVSFLENDGAGALSFRARSATGRGPTFLATGDVEDDNRVDVFVACPGTDSLTRLRNQGSFTFARTELFVGDRTNFITLADMDRDNDLDLLAIPKNGKGGILLNDSIGNFVLRQDLTFVTVRDVTFAALYDLNGDRGFDLLTASYASSRLAVAFGSPVR